MPPHFSAASFRLSSILSVFETSQKPPAAHPPLGKDPGERGSRADDQHDRRSRKNRLLHALDEFLPGQFFVNETQDNRINNGNSSCFGCCHDTDTDTADDDDRKAHRSDGAADDPAGFALRKMRSFRTGRIISSLVGDNRNP